MTHTPPRRKEPAPLYRLMPYRPDGPMILRQQPPPPREPLPPLSVAFYLVACGLVGSGLGILLCAILFSVAR